MLKLKSIYQHYRETLHNPDLRYYSTQDWNKDPEDILNPDGAQTFIHSIINAGKKSTGEVFQLIDKLNPVRSYHILSTYLLGITLYQTPCVNKHVNTQLARLTTIDGCLTRRFLYIWFLICFFHDLGYAYETGCKPLTKSHKYPTIDKRYSNYSMLPTIYDTNLVRRYMRFRQQCMCVIDHGIIGGQIMYEELYNLLRPRKEIVSVFKTVSSIIMVHNIFYQKETSLQATCYRHYQLDELLYKGRKSRKISLEDNPLLFLFDLVDSIEPLKSISVDKLENIEIECNSDILVVKTPSTRAYSKLCKRLKDINSWLADVQKISDDTFIVSL